MDKTHLLAFLRSRSDRLSMSAPPGEVGPPPPAGKGHAHSPGLRVLSVLPARSGPEFAGQGCMPLVGRIFQMKEWPPLSTGEYFASDQPPFMEL